MEVKLVIICALLKIVGAKISININTDSGIHNVSITYDGSDSQVVNALDIDRFNLRSHIFKEAVKTHFGEKPSNIYFKSPTPWDDLYKKYNWEQVTRVITVKSASVRDVKVKPVIVLSHDFENSSNKTIKVNTGISQTIEHTISTSWSKNQEVSISQEVEYDLNILVAKLSGTTGLTYTSSLGKSEEKSESVSVGATSAVETELAPGQAVTAVLSAKRGHFEIEVVYQTTLRGKLAVNFKRGHNGHHFYGPSIKKVFKSGGLKNEITETERIKVGFYAEASLKVFDKTTGLPV
ncbi:spherulin-2A-like [Leguminivora glycinivorella]|uniref:spherulin-2A-like n=1 Tax=Leguminivora glycinivorella TaxID=1035111 RepID=UPI002010A869|nr:spherulin-2A-like [Leguminivora glycinivorella]